MLLNEASIYETLQPLHDRCVPQAYGFFDSERAYVLVMQYVGSVIRSVEELSLDRWFVVPGVPSIF
jgi:hypothetical protein